MGVGALTLAGINSFSNFHVFSQPVEISFWSHTYKPWNDLLKKHIKEFEADHNVKVSYSYVQHQQLQGKLETAFKAKTAPDIVGAYSTWLKKYIDQGLLAFPPSWVEEDINNNAIDLAKEYMLDGNYLGYTQHYGMYSPIFNKSIYEQKGIDPMSVNSWDDVIEADKKITEKRGGRLVKAGFALNREYKEDIALVFATLLRSNGGNILNDEGSRAAFNSEAGRKSLKTFSQLTPSEFSGSGFSGQYVVGILGGMRTGVFSKGTIKENSPEIFKNSVLSKPFKGTDRRSTATYAWLWCVNKRTSDKKKENAWKLLKYMSAPEQYKELITNLGFAPINEKGIQYADDWTTTFTENAASYGERWHAFTAKWPSISLAISDNIRSVISGEVNVNKGLAKAEKQVNKILA